ncbi:MAG: sigma 54-interacting transcriptional regulator [Polyangiaceae bacterium]
MASGRTEPTATEATSVLARVQITRADVEVTTGPDAPHACPVTPTGIVVGTGFASDLRLTDSQVSRRHVELCAEARGVRVRDLGSRNGTYLAGARVTEVVLEKDAVLRVGQTELTVRLGADPVEVVLSPRERFGEAIGASVAIRHVFSLLEQAARTDVTILFEGDSGTGKDVLASSVHQESDRRDGPFVVVDCGSIPEHLVESELFGHERGAFTGAVSQRIGAFEQADGGTLFLDEIGELPLELQPKLLRALEARTFRRVGGSQAIRFDARIIAATNRRLREAVRRGEFREDLLYRLAVVHVHVPSLRDRRADVPMLAEHFLRRAIRDPKATLPPDLAHLVQAYDWPGNARELRNVIDRFVTFRRVDEKLLLGDLGPRADATPEPAPAPMTVDLKPLLALTYHEAKKQLVEELHRVLLPKVVEEEGSVPRAAERLALPRTSLYRMLKEARGEADDDD